MHSSTTGSIKNHQDKQWRLSWIHYRLRKPLVATLSGASKTKKLFCELFLFWCISSSNRFRRQLLGACGAGRLFPESLSKEQILNRNNSNQISANCLIPKEYEKTEKESIDLESAEKLLVTSQNGTDELQLFRPSYHIWQDARNTNRADGEHLKDSLVFTKSLLLHICTCMLYRCTGRWTCC